jgi:DNA-binding transcriptional MerR regulator
VMRMFLPVLLSQCKRASGRDLVYAAVMAAPSSPASPAAADEFTIDQLAARTGMTVRTVRFYATQGLLPPPRRQGRLAYYGAGHRMRLELIRALQEHGYTLAAIERVLARIPADAPAAEYAVHAAVLAPWLPDQSEELDRAAIDRRLGRRITDDELGYCLRLGAVRSLGEDRFAVSTAMLGSALELLQLSVPGSVLRDSAALIGEHATAVANGLTEVFIKAIWGPYQQGQMDSEQVVAMLSRLRPLAVQGLVSAFGRAADRAARRGLEKDGPVRDLDAG